MTTPPKGRNNLSYDELQRELCPKRSQNSHELCQRLKTILNEFGTYTPKLGGKYSWRELHKLIKQQELSGKISPADEQWMDIQYKNQQTSSTSSSTPPFNVLPPVNPIAGSPTLPPNPPLPEVLRPDIPTHSHVTVTSLCADQVRTQDLFVTNWCKLSDENAKEDISEISSRNPLDIMKQVGVYKYKYKEEFGGNGQEDIGFIAQQLQKIYPQLVQKHESGLLSIKPNDILALLTQSVKVLSHDADNVTAKLSEMKIAQSRPVLLLSFEKNEIVLNPNALKILNDLPRVSVLAVCGQVGNGNSTLCNQLLPTDDKAFNFTTRHGAERCTNGIWMSSPIDDDNIAYIVLDSQGFNWSDSGTKLLSFLCMISNMLVLCQRMAPTNVVLDNLQILVEVQKTLENLKATLPSLFMLFKDAQSKTTPQPVVQQRGRPRADTYQSNFAIQMYTALEQQSSIYKAISKFYYYTIKELPNPNEGEENFQQALSILRGRISQYSTTSLMSGPTLVQKITTAVGALRSNVPIKIETPSQLDDCRNVAEEVFAGYLQGEIAANQVLTRYKERTSHVPREFVVPILNDLQEELESLENVIARVKGALMTTNINKLRLSTSSNILRPTYSAELARSQDISALEEENRKKAQEQLKQQREMEELRRQEEIRKQAELEWQGRSQAERQYQEQMPRERQADARRYEERAKQRPSEPPRVPQQTYQQNSQGQIYSNHATLSRCTFSYVSQKLQKSMVCTGLETTWQWLQANSKESRTSGGLDGARYFKTDGSVGPELFAVRSERGDQGETRRRVYYHDNNSWHRYETGEVMNLS